MIIPAAIVIITAAAEPENLINEHFCLVRGISFYIGVLTPVVIILTFNMIVVICSIKSLSPTSLESNRMSLWQQCKITICMTILLGGTWLFALFAVAMATVPFQIIFTMLTSLQGFFVFVLFVLLKKEMRKMLRNWWRRQQYAEYFKCFKFPYCGKESKEFITCNNDTLHNSSKQNQLKRNATMTSADGMNWLLTAWRELFIWCRGSFE